MPSVLDRLWRGTFWLALKSPLQVIIAFWSVPLIQHAIGAEANGAYVFAWGFGFIQFLLEFGMGSALQRQVSHAWTIGDRAQVNRLVVCGIAFYGIMALVQMVILLCIAYFGLPPRFQGASLRLIVGLLWVQALSAPFYGLLTVVSSVLLAGGRYAILPMLDLLILVLRFVILIMGLRTGVDFLTIIEAQMIVLLGGMLIPALWVMIHELRCVPVFTVPRARIMRGYFRSDSTCFLMQLSVVLADKVDTTILGYALPDTNPGPAITVYQNVSKPFFQIRQTAWTMAYLVVPVVARLAAARDSRSLDQLKYDGTRFLVGLLLPVALLAGLYAEPFLNLWVGPRYVPYAPLLRLFLVAALPMVLSVLTQMAIGMGKIKVVALAPLVGSLVNLPLSYYLTTRLGVSGVIWGTVLTTLFSNMLIPGVYLFRLLEIPLSTFLVRTLRTPLTAVLFLVPAAWICRAIVPPAPIGTTALARSLPLVLNLVVGTAAYVLGYAATPQGRADLAALARHFRIRRVQVSL